MPELKNDILIPELVIEGFDADPSIISDIIGLRPTIQWRRGDAYRAGVARYRRTNGWVLRSGIQEESGFVEQFETLLANIAPRADGFAKLPWDASCSMGCIGTVRMHRMLRFNSEHVESLARLRCGLYVDIFVIDKPEVSMLESRGPQTNLVSKLVLSADETDPSSLTHMLGIGPSSTWKDGCWPSDLPAQLRSRHGWIYNSWASAESDSLCSHLESLLAMFSTRTSELRNRPDDIKVNILSVGNSCNSRPVLEYSFEAIKMLGRWRAGILHDVVDCS